MVSVIIPCYNYGRFLREAIDSALPQKAGGQAVEVLVIDDGSTDDSPEIAATYGSKIRYLRKKNGGLSAARNTGMEEAAHDWVVFLDADDLLMPDAVEILWEASRKASPMPAVLAGQAWWIDGAGKPIQERPSDSGEWTDFSAVELVIRNRFTPGILADRRVLLGLGGFDPALKASEDRDMWIRAAATHRVAYVQRNVILKRDHGANMSRAANQQTAYILHVLEKAFKNPDIHLTAREKQLAFAVCWYQSALMYAEARDWQMALHQLMRSFSTWPLGSIRASGVAPWSRIRGLVGMVVGGLKSRLPSS